MNQTCPLDDLLRIPSFNYSYCGRWVLSPTKDLMPANFFILGIGLLAMSRHANNGLIALVSGLALVSHFLPAILFHVKHDSLDCYLDQLQLASWEVIDEYR